MISCRYILTETFGRVRNIFPSDWFLFAQLSKGNAVKDFEWLGITCGWHRTIAGKVNHDEECLDSSAIFVGSCV
jgi:hypothetical protein